MRHETAEKIIDALEAHFGRSKEWWDRGDMEYVREALIDALTDSMGLFQYVGPPNCGEVIEAYRAQLVRCGWGHESDPPDKCTSALTMAMSVAMLTAAKRLTCRTRCRLNP